MMHAGRERYVGTDLRTDEIPKQEGETLKKAISTSNTRQSGDGDKVEIYKGLHYLTLASRKGRLHIKDHEM